MENQRVILLRDQRHEFDKRSRILRKCSSASEPESFSGMTSFYSCFLSARHEQVGGEEQTLVVACQTLADFALMRTLKLVFILFQGRLCNTLNAWSRRYMGLLLRVYVLLRSKGTTKYIPRFELTSLCSGTKNIIMVMIGQVEAGGPCTNF